MGLISRIYCESKLTFYQKEVSHCKHCIPTNLTINLIFSFIYNLVGTYNKMLISLLPILSKVRAVAKADTNNFDSKRYISF